MSSGWPDMRNDNVVFLGHTGLGDAFVQKGIVRQLAGMCRQIEIVAYNKYLQSLQDIYADVPNHKFLLINHVEDISPAYGGSDSVLKQRLAAGDVVVALGWHSAIPNWDKADPSWANCLYKMVGLDPRLMYTHFGSIHLDRDNNARLFNAAVSAVGPRYAVIHDDPKREFLVPRERLDPEIPWIHVDDPRIFSFRELLHHAADGVSTEADRAPRGNAGDGGCALSVISGGVAILNERARSGAQGFVAPVAWASCPCVLYSTH